MDNNWWINSFWIPSGSEIFCRNQSHIVLTSVFYSHIRQWQCHAVWYSETNEISHLWHILPLSCCKIIRSNDSGGLIWWISGRERMNYSVLYRQYSDLMMFVLDPFPFTPDIKMFLRCLKSDVLISVLLSSLGSCNRCRTKKSTCTHSAIQLAVAVWYLASGTDFTTLSQLVGVEKWTVSKYVWDILLCYTQTKKVD